MTRQADRASDVAGAGRLLTAGEVANRLGVPASWVYAQSRRGGIPTVTLGRYRRYRAEAIDEWVAGLELHGTNGRGLDRQKGSRGA